MNNPVNNSVFDTRDLQVYIEYLGVDLVRMWNDYISEGTVSSKDAENIWDVDFEDEGFFNMWGGEIEEYERLVEFAEAIQQCTGSSYGSGTAVISEDYWEQYCEQYCKDVGFISDNIPSWIEVDWYKTSQNMEVDYSKIGYDGDYYYVRIS